MRGSKLSRNNSATKILRWISIGIFIISLTQKTYCTPGDCSSWGAGFYAVVLGWIGLFVGGAFISWLANPAIIISWVFVCRNNMVATFFSGIATVLCFCFLFFDKIMVDEAGNYSQITGYQMGYWLWTLSSLVFFLGNIWLQVNWNRQS